MPSITISPEHGYVFAVIALTGLLAQWHTWAVGGFRRAAGVPYPNGYATHEEAMNDIKKYKFNCAQRAHCNYLESVSIALPLMIVSGPLYPMTTAALGGVYLLGRIVYMIGYMSCTPGDGGRKRYRGMFYHVGQLGLVVTAGLSVWSICCPK